MTITRRGFLSLCAALPILARIPPSAEPIIQEAETLPLVPPPEFKLIRYALALAPDSSAKIEPGRVTILRALVPRMLRPERLQLNCGGFNLLHLGMNHEPILADEIPSEFFMPTSYFKNLPMATVQPGEEIIIAAVNRNRTAEYLIGSMITTALEPDTSPLTPRNV
jgi:hypothetical protein